MAKTGNVLQVVEDQNISDSQFNGLTEELGGDKLVLHDSSGVRVDNAQLGDNTATASNPNGAVIGHIQQRSGYKLQVINASGTIIDQIDLTATGVSGKLNVNFGFKPQDGVDEFKVEQLSAGVGQGVEVDDDGGTFYGSDDAIFVKSSGSNTLVSLSASDGSNPRWDLISLDASAGTYTVTEGTAAAAPVFPATPANEDALAFVYRKASTPGNTIYDNNIFDVRQSLTHRNGNGHFATNFSIDQKEDTESTEFENQPMFQMIPFETKFDSIQPDKTALHTVETVLVPPFSHEVTETGTWVDSDSASYVFGTARDNTVAGGTSSLSFTGVGCGIFYQVDTNSGDIYTEISNDGGSTWTNKKVFEINGGNNVNTYIECYSGLEYGDYVLRVTGNRKGAIRTILLEGFYYTTHMQQRPCTQYALTSGGAADINDVPPNTSLFDGSWTVNNSDLTNAWNGSYSFTSADGAYIEYMYYGKEVYANLGWTTNGNITVTPLIDGSSAKVKSTTFNLDTAFNFRWTWIRIDDGTLEEGWHTVRLTRTTGTGGHVLHAMGWGHHSDFAPTPTARSLICGSESYAVGIDDSGFTLNGTWSGPNLEAQEFLRRSAATTNQNDYATYTTPNNAKLKAIYSVHTINTNRGEIKVSLGGASSNVRYINVDSANYSHFGVINLLYDSLRDGDLHNKELRILNNEAVAMNLSAVIFEIGDAVESDHIWCMPKWTRYQSSGNPRPNVASGYRLDVYGAKSDNKPGLQPQIHSGWVVVTGTGIYYWRSGIPWGETTNWFWQICGEQIPYTGSAETSRLPDEDLYGILNTDTDIGAYRKRAGSDGTALYAKFFATLRRVI